MTLPAFTLAVAPDHADATAIHAVPATETENGFRLLVMRELMSAEEPSGFAVIEQRLLRAPPRTIRHGVAFALAFGPKAVAWLSLHLGKPAARDADGTVIRNADWPQLAWRRQQRVWADGTHSIEWSADIRFSDPATREAFARAFAAELAGATPIDA